MFARSITEKNIDSSMCSTMIDNIPSDVFDLGKGI